MEHSRSAPVPYREPRSRQGFGRGKSITYGRLSPPLSAFNHTLCEQNIKTCPFVCPEADRCRSGAGVGARELARERRSGLRRRRPATYFVTWQSLLGAKFSEVFLQRSAVIYCNVWRLVSPRAPRLSAHNFAALLSLAKFKLKLCSL